MAYRLLLPATLDLVPADVDAALKGFGATPLSDRGCAWALPEAGAPGVASDAAAVIVRLLPAKALTLHPEEPPFRIPKGTQRALEVITPVDDPKPADCRRVQDCAAALAHELGLGVLNPYRSQYAESAAAFRTALSDPPEPDVPHLRVSTTRTQRSTGDRTRPAHARVARAPRNGQTGTGMPAAEEPGWLVGLMMRLRGARRHRLMLPQGCSTEYVEALVRQIRVAVPMAKVSVTTRRRSVVIDAPDTPLVTRTVAELIRRYGAAAPQALEAAAASA